MVLNKRFIMLVLFGLVFISNTLLAQNNLVSKENLRQHVYALADDSMGGRNTATAGGAMAARYISAAFRNVGLLPKQPNQSYVQDFEYFAGKIYSNKNKLIIGKSALVAQKDYDVLNNASNGNISTKLIYVGNGIVIPGKIDDYNGKANVSGMAFLIDIATPKEIGAHSEDYKQTELTIRIETAIKKGAAAIIFFSSDSNEVLKPNLKERAKECGVPLVFLKQKPNESELNNPNTKVVLSVNLMKEQKTSQNIIGFIDNKSKNTIVIGAHYDHLGLGEDGNSLYKGAPAIHNGADDNASGVASIIELARKIKAEYNTYKKYNYMFLAFSGEELGLYGSKAFVDNLSNQIDSQNIDCMINLDMVGRLSNKDKNLEINGVGSSPSFDTILDAVSLNDLRIKKGLSGIGPSDHSSFYLKNIPVLHFFTGQHEDYHKPTDDAEKVNIDGMQKVCEYILLTIQEIEKRDKLSFTKTKQDSSAAPRYKISLGIIPDYMYDGDGLRIDGVSDGRPAQKAGLQKGDIVLQLGENKVGDMSGYMKALSEFKKGDETTVIIKRGKEMMSFKVIF